MGVRAGAAFAMRSGRPAERDPRLKRRSTPTSIKSGVRNRLLGMGRSQERHRLREHRCGRENVPRASDCLRTLRGSDIAWVLDRSPLQESGLRQPGALGGGPSENKYSARQAGRAEDALSPRPSLDGRAHLQPPRKRREDVWHLRQGAKRGTGSAQVARAPRTTALHGKERSSS
jgi:hypothetical protein